MQIELYILDVMIICLSMLKKEFKTARVTVIMRLLITKVTLMRGLTVLMECHCCV